MVAFAHADRVGVANTETELDVFESLALRRRSVRHFQSDPIPVGILDRLLNAAHWAPSGYNLQPTHFFVVRGDAAKKRLHRAALGQDQILEAPVTIVFAGDKRVYEHDFERVLSTERAAGAVDEKYEMLLRKFVPLTFKTGPLGLNWAWKAALTALAPLVRLVAPMPAFPAVHKNTWLVRQAMLPAMNFMLAATAAGLATVPMEGFDEPLVRKACEISPNFRVCLIVPVGYPADRTPPKKTRLPLAERVHDVRA